MVEYKIWKITEWESRLNFCYMIDRQRDQIGPIDQRKSRYHDLTCIFLYFSFILYILYILYFVFCILYFVFCILYLNCVFLFVESLLTYLLWALETGWWRSCPETLLKHQTLSKHKENDTESDKENYKENYKTRQDITLLPMLPPWCLWNVGHQGG